MSKPMPVLIVDDDPDICQLLVLLLKTRGFSEFRTAASGAEAKALIETHPEPHIVLVDVRMPGASGCEFVKWLAAQPRAVHDRIALMSGGAPEAEELQGFPFLAKPFDFERLFSFVRALEPEPETTA